MLTFTIHFRYVLRSLLGSFSRGFFGPFLAAKRVDRSAIDRFWTSLKVRPGYKIDPWSAKDRPGHSKMAGSTFEGWGCFWIFLRPCWDFLLNELLDPLLIDVDPFGMSCWTPFDCFRSPFRTHFDGFIVSKVLKTSGPTKKTRKHIRNKKEPQKEQRTNNNNHTANKD